MTIAAITWQGKVEKYQWDFDDEATNNAPGNIVLRNFACDKIQLLIVQSILKTWQCKSGNINERREVIKVC